MRIVKPGENGAVMSSPSMPQKSTRRPPSSPLGSAPPHISPDVSVESSPALSLSSTRVSARQLPDVSSHAAVPPPKSTLFSPESAQRVSNSSTSSLPPNLSAAHAAHSVRANVAHYAEIAAAASAASTPPPARRKSSLTNGSHGGSDHQQHQPQQSQSPPLSIQTQPQRQPTTELQRPRIAPPPPPAATQPSYALGTSLFPSMNSLAPSMDGSSDDQPSPADAATIRCCNDQILALGESMSVMTWRLQSLQQQHRKLAVGVDEAVQRRDAIKLELEAARGSRAELSRAPSSDAALLVMSSSTSSLDLLAASTTTDEEAAVESTMQLMLQRYLVDWTDRQQAYGRLCAELRAVTERLRHEQHADTQQALYFDAVAALRNAAEFLLCAG